MTIDLTGIIISIITGAFGIVGTVFLAWLQSHMKDQQAASVLAAAIRNSLGAGQQAALGLVTSLHPAVSIPGVPAALAVQTQYVLDHASDEAARLGITPAAIADKVNAQIGLTAIAATVAPVAASVHAAG